MAYSTKTIEQKDTWENFILSHPEANFLQSWNWGEFHQALGHKIIRTGFFKDSKLQGVMLCVVERAKRGKYLTVPGGPILDWTNKELVKAFKSEIKSLASTHNCSFVRVRPQLESNDFSKELFKTLGFKIAPMHLHAELTNQLDVKKPEQDLLANMRKATRYEIRKAEKLEITIKESTDFKDIKKFYNLQMETAKRQGFVPFSLKFLEEQFRVFANTGNAILYSSYFEKKLLAQAFIIFYGTEAVYHYGASTNDGRQYPGAYLIQWHAIKEAKKRGISVYNFWGVAAEGHRFSNLSMFKRGFGGEDFAYLHAQDLVINYPKYFINFLVETIRRKIRKV
ncbi:MAG: peptidoglycan bridge formation glycyltransferase FemA/FemB family protein [Candidatus Levybacteria bacterium]|nr:peptidoglycan bridge formation glycyltransferase FemA/FemB family protein [Candidatus Levybacteria bacterium]